MTSNCLRLNTWTYLKMWNETRIQNSIKVWKKYECWNKLESEKKIYMHIKKIKSFLLKNNVENNSIESHPPFYIFPTKIQWFVSNIKQIQRVGAVIFIFRIYFLLFYMSFQHIFFSYVFLFFFCTIWGNFGASMKRIWSNKILREEF